MIEPQNIARENFPESASDAESVITLSVEKILLIMYILELGWGNRMF